MISQARLQECIAALDNRPGGLAAEPIPAGITRLLLLTLDPPEDVWRDTKYKGASQLPAEISVRDDLVLLKNLLRHWDLGELVKVILDLPRVPGDHFALTAPSLASALSQITEQVTEKNIPFEAMLAIQEDRAIISFQSHPAVGLFGEILELLAGAVFYRLIRSFLEFTQNKAQSLGSIRFQWRSAEEEPLAHIEGFDWIEIRRAGRGSSMSLPVHLLEVPNPSIFSDQPSQPTVRDTGRERAGGSGFDIDELEEMIDRSLRSRSRAVQLDEIARHFGISNRTVLRHVSQSGRSLRQIVTGRRMEMARGLLSGTTSKIAEVSHAVGYSDPSSFVRAFRQWHGMPPYQWRKAGERADGHRSKG